MSNWRELGYVPNSDDEDSDGALSTQEDTIPEYPGPKATCIGIENVDDSRERELVVEGNGKEEEHRVLDAVAAQHMDSEMDAVMNDAVNEDYVDIDHVAGAVPGAKSAVRISPYSRKQPSGLQSVLNEIRREGIDVREVSVLDLSDLPDEPDAPIQLGDVEKEDTIIDLSNEEDVVLQDIREDPLSVENPHETSERDVRLSPDPITGEKQGFLETLGQKHTKLFEDFGGPSTPTRLDFRQSVPVVDSSSMIDSSPLSSPPSTDGTPPRSSTPQRITSLTSAFHIAVPSREENHDQWAAPVRTFRERKPIQKNPYLIEGERYRQTLKSRGVKPLRIHEVEAEVHRVQVADKDSQEDDYVAPPEPDHQPRRRVHPREDEVQLSEDNNIEAELPTNTNPARERLRPNNSSPNEAKRRKMIHTYSKRNPGRANETPRRPQGKENNRPSLTVQTNGMASGTDIYDLPLGSPRRSPSITPLAQSVLAQPDRLPGEETSNPIRGPPGQRGILAVMDSDYDSDPEPIEQSRRVTTVPPTRPSPITILSSPPSSPSSSDMSEEGNEEEEEEDESQLIRKFQRKTTGVLPASWWKLDKNQQRGGQNKTQRGARSTESPTQDVTPRPGIARAKVSSRARSPDGDVFLLGDDSDASSDEPALIMPPTLAKRTINEKDLPVRNWIDLDDIMEDDRIDPMLPSTSRKRNAQTKRKKKRADGNQTSQGGLTASDRIHTSTSRLRNGSTHLHQPKITDHVSSKRRATRRKKPTAPRVGIVDAVRHYQATTTAPPPIFIKLAERRAKERRDQGRQSPSRKLFVLETEMDTRDIQAVLRDWREGTLSFVAQNDLGGSYQDSSLSRARDHGNTAPNHQLRLPSPQRLGGSQAHSSDRRFGPSPSTAKPLQPRGQGSRQTTLSNIVRKAPVSKRISTTTHSRQQGSFITHRPNFTPQAAQFEVEKPINRTLKILHQAPRRAKTPDLATLLRNTALRNPNLRRFMEDDDIVQPMPQASATVHNTAKAIPDQRSEVPKSSRPAPRTRRKRTPQRLDANTIERRQPPLHDIFIDDVDLNIPDEIPITNKPVLQGLLQYRSSYSLTFDTIPFKSGTIFNSETFIGDGSLSRALNTPPARESRGSQSSNFTFGDKIIHWGVYEDSVAAEFETIMNQIADVSEKSHEENDLDGAEFHRLTSQTYFFSKFFSNYLAQIVTFPDSIDIVSFGQRVLQALEICCGRVLTTFGSDCSRSNPKNTSTRLKLQLVEFSLVFTFQIYQLASGDAEVQARLEIEKSLRKTGQRLLGQLLKCGLDEVRACYEDQRQHSKYEKGIDREHYVVEAWTIAIQVLNHTKFLGFGFWELLNAELRPADLEKALDVRLFEKNWRTIFTILPLHQFDNLGFVQQPSKDNHFPENWTLLKSLIGRPLRVYNFNPEGHSGTINDYCRVLYARCHHLINSWGWANPDIIIPTLYEFFANKGLANLRNENGFGSPEFLQDLEKDPPLLVQDSDRCFHLLLKIVAIGIKSMITTSTARKIGSMVNRLMPNHRRQYPKEEELHVEHLNSLRNHHDLLATLYWAAPQNCRPPLDAIRDLVDPETSHLQACSVSIRTWSNLLRFKLHSGEDIESLRPFMEWFDEIVTRILGQHYTARSEAEKIFKAAKENGDTDLSEDMLEGTIRRNQKNLEDVLNNAVKSLCTALSGINGQIESARVVLTKASTSHILGSYNRLSHKLVVEVLHLVKQYLLVCEPKRDLSSATVQVDEDSQDYGDWSGFDDLVVQDTNKPAAEHLLATVYESLHRMLSNCFGADKQPEESLLIEIVNTWTLVSGFLVQSGLKKWNSYLDNYGSESWSSLRDTEQTRKFTAYFMSKIISQTKADVYEAQKTTFISYWLKTLVERESMLKFQNEYTMTLLNCDSENPIFRNLPFARDELSEKFSITQSDFRLRRLSLISMVLANMREHYNYEATHGDSPKKAACLKQEYNEMLTAMMKSMKENYKELQTKAASGAYVEFVQQVVEYLQQHSSDLVSIDRFFTDSSAFPLPTTDPTYVVGKLKNYGLRLQFPSGHKPLISYLETTCERAAADRKQEYLVSQLTTALSGSFEDGDPNKPTLRAFFVGVVFPVYVEYTFRESWGWIQAVPMLKAVEQVIFMMREDIDSTLYSCVKSVLSMLSSLLEAMRLSVEFLKPSEIFSPSVLGPFTIMVSIITKAIPIIDWLSASRDEEDTIVEVAYDCICFLIKYSGYIRNLVENREAEVPVDVRRGQRFEGRHETARKDFATSLKTTMKREWTSHGGCWYVVRGSYRKEMYPPTLWGEKGGLEIQKKVFREVVENLLKVSCRTEKFGAAGRSVDEGIWEYEGRGKPYRDSVYGRKQHGRALRSLGDLLP